jgi:MYXO-CTERM domain-containing protein
MSSTGSVIRPPPGIISPRNGMVSPPLRQSVPTPLPPRPVAPEEDAYYMDEGEDEGEGEGGWGGGDDADGGEGGDEGDEEHWDEAAHVSEAAWEGEGEGEGEDAYYEPEPEPEPRGPPPGGAGMMGLGMMAGRQRRRSFGSHVVSLTLF